MVQIKVSVLCVKLGRKDITMPSKIKRQINISFAIFMKEWSLGYVPEGLGES